MPDTEGPAQLPVMVGFPSHYPIPPFHLELSHDTKVREKQGLDPRRRFSQWGWKAWKLWAPVPGENQYSVTVPLVYTSTSITNQYQYLVRTIIQYQCHLPIPSQYQMGTSIRTMIWTVPIDGGRSCCSDNQLPTLYPWLSKVSTSSLLYILASCKYDLLYPSTQNVPSYVSPDQLIWTFFCKLVCLL